MSKPSSSLFLARFWTGSETIEGTVAGFFRGNSTHLFGITRFGAPGIYIRAGSSHLNEVVWPQSPRTAFGQVIPPIVA